MPSLTGRNTLTEQVAQHLGQQIIRGHYPPRRKLKELDIARELSVSSNTVREAFHIVEKRHLVTIEPGRGAFVSEITPAQVTQLYDFVLLLLGELAKRTARQWQEKDVAEFLALVKRMNEQQKANDAAAFHATAFEFVHQSLQFCDNRYLEKALTDMLPELQRFSYLALQAEASEIAESCALFQAIMDSMLRRDAEATAVAARAYGENQSRIVLKAIGATP